LGLLYADPDPVSYSNTYPDTDPASKNKADPDSEPAKISSVPIPTFFRSIFYHRVKNYTRLDAGRRC
jgi:hypothetical protein